MQPAIRIGQSWPRTCGPRSVQHRPSILYPSSERPGCAHIAPTLASIARVPPGS